MGEFCWISIIFHKSSNLAFQEQEVADLLRILQLKARIYAGYRSYFSIFG